MAVERTLGAKISNTATKEKTILAWSSGKDSAWALHVLRQDQNIDVVGLLTTVNKDAQRVAMHAVRETVLQAQADATGLPLHKVPIPEKCSNADYDHAMQTEITKLQKNGITTIAFGDLFLEDIRRYREERLAPTGIKPVFPLWGQDTRTLANQMVSEGLRASITCVDTKQLDASFIGRTFNNNFISDLPASVDPCGENGEFHSFAYAGPMFTKPLSIVPGETVTRDQFIFGDLTLSDS